MTEKYYTPCNETQHDLISPSVSVCRQFNPPNGNCCLVYLDDGYYDYDDDNDDGDAGDIVRFNVTKKRNLYTYDQFCFGFTQEGLNNIRFVEHELAKKFEAVEVHIDCTQKNLKYNLLNTLIIIILIIMNL